MRRFDYRYLLFAGHAVLPEEVSYIQQPALVLAHTEVGEEGFLTMGEVFGLQNNGLVENLRQAKLEMLRGDNEIHRHPSCPGLSG